MVAQERAWGRWGGEGEEEDVRPPADPGDYPPLRKTENRVRDSEIKSRRLKEVARVPFLCLSRLVCAVDHGRTPSPSTFGFLPKKAVFPAAVARLTSSSSFVRNCVLVFEEEGACRARDWGGKAFSGVIIYGRKA